LIHEQGGWGRGARRRGRSFAADEKGTIRRRAKTPSFGGRAEQVKGRYTIKKRLDQESMKVKLEKTATSLPEGCWKKVEDEAFAESTY